MRQALIIGCGSIGLRHKKILDSLNVATYFVSSRTDKKDLEPIMYRSLEKALMYQKYDLIIIANETIKHEKTLDEIKRLGYNGTLLVEKPLFANAPLVLNKDYCVDNIFIGYNLRLHALICEIKRLIAHKKIYSVQFNVGQYLPTWRERDYRFNYSSKKSMGGGVLRDLSHELDLALYLFGNVKKVVSNIGRYSNLQIDSEDTVDILASLDRCNSVSIHLDYTDTIKRRTICLQGENISIEANLIANTLCVNNTQQHLVTKDTYLAQIEALLERDTSTLASYDDGLRVMDFIKKVEANTI